jgi:phosphopantothenoylcysteine decarboxylase/phosphopantothenate--cysteine ligase
VQTDVWTDVSDVPHVRLGQQADLVVIAPATADLLARAAAGLADDLLTATLLTARCPVLIAPAMHTEMWDHPATQANVDLRSSAAAVSCSIRPRAASPAPTPARAAARARGHRRRMPAPAHRAPWPGSRLPSPAVPATGRPAGC